MAGTPGRLWICWRISRNASLDRAPRFAFGCLVRIGGFTGFVDYLASKPWGFDPSRAYQMIDSKRISTIVEVANEAQARELAPLLRTASPGGGGSFDTPLCVAGVPEGFGTHLP